MGPRGLAIAFKAFVRPVCEYGNVVFMGATSTHLSKLDGIQRLASESTFPTLCSRCSASAIGLLCKMLASCCQDPLATPVSHSYYLRNSRDDHLLLLSPVHHNSLDLFRRSFLGTISHLWASTPSDV